MDLPAHATLLTGTAREAGEMLGRLSFRFPFRKYQRMILAQVESAEDDRKYHIVAPPGSGKTIVGLELIRRFGAPAVVFAPTTTIQQQWQERVGMFTEHDQVALITSLDPERLAPINVFTYQLISTSGEAQEHARQLALQEWVDELLSEGPALAALVDESAVRLRLDALRRNNPREYARELARRYLRVKRRLLYQGDVELGDFLHPNARHLIQRLVAYGVRTVVLDECHHLLDYWALVLRYLIQQISQPYVVGLTATLPSPEGDKEYENYTSLLGDVDFEVPTPAVVKEGDLAPYRDLVYFVEPSGRERAYLRNIQAAFEGAIESFASDPSFVAWVAHLVLERPGGDGGQVPWEDFLNDQPLLSLAGLRFLRRIGHVIPSSLLVPQEVYEPLEMEDWLNLLERYALDVLKVSADPEDHGKLAELRRVLLPFGLTLTEKGMRHGRSPGDLVLAMSESKDAAVAHILAEESAALGDRLRAVVVTDFERMAAGVGRGLAGVLERDAGSAVRVFSNLVADGRTRGLHPVLVTGSRVMAGAEDNGELLDYLSRYLRSQGLQMARGEAPFAGVMELSAEGGDWSSRVYVRMITAAFERGLTKCLVGTRGIFGEGWDSLVLNTLVDLTGVTTSTSVQQLRGRSIRLDPSWPRKVAHNWDVVCVAPEFKRGDIDLRRFEQRHRRYWGVAPVGKIRQALADASEASLAVVRGSDLDAGPSFSAAIVKGVPHVDRRLAWELATRKFYRIDFRRYNERMLAQVGARDRSYDMWGVGQDYSNFPYAATRLETRDLKIRTVFTVQDTVKRLLREFRASLVFWVLLAGIVAVRAVLLQGGSPALGSPTEGLATFLGGTALLLLMVAPFATLFSARSAYRLGKALLVEQRPDAILLDVGRALLAALKDAGLASSRLQLEYVRVVEQPDSSYEVLLDYASPDDAATFASAYREIFEPVRDQRYLILRDDSRLPSLALAPAWLLLRAWLRRKERYRQAYHPVPRVLSTRKERAEALAHYWREYVGGGQLVFTRSERGRRVLLEARAQRRPKVRSLAFELWR